MISNRPALAFAHSLVMPNYQAGGDLRDGPDLELCELFAERDVDDFGDGHLDGAPLANTAGSGPTGAGDLDAAALVNATGAGERSDDRGSAAALVAPT